MPAWLDTLMGNLFHAATSFVWLALMFVPLERMFPATHGQRFVRKGFWTDVAFFLGQYIAFLGLITLIIHAVVEPVATYAWPWLSKIHHGFDQIPWLLQLLIVIMSGDFLAYWGHRLQHRVDFLWRFHAVHHSTEELDWLAAHREHPLDGLYTHMMINLPAIVLGFAVSEIMALVIFRGVWAIFIHSNVRLPLGPLKYLVGAPILHHWHHAKDRDVGNYANLAPWLDLLFGTYHCPDHEPESVGLDEPFPTSYPGLILKPMLPRITRERLTKS